MQECTIRYINHLIDRQKQLKERRLALGLLQNLIQAKTTKTSYYVGFLLRSYIFTPLGVCTMNKSSVIKIPDLLSGNMEMYTYFFIRKCL